MYHHLMQIYTLRSHSRAYKVMTLHARKLGFDSHNEENLFLKLKCEHMTHSKRLQKYISNTRCRLAKERKKESHFIWAADLLDMNA